MGRNKRRREEMYKKIQFYEKLIQVLWGTMILILIIVGLACIPVCQDEDLIKLIICIGIVLDLAILLFLLIINFVESHIVKKYELEVDDE